LLKKPGLEMSAWSHLPNATHIDQVLADLTAHPDEFVVAWGAAGYAVWTAAYDAAWDAAWAVARLEARDTVLSAAGVSAWTAAAGVSAWTAAWDAARSAITALVAWDHAANYLDMTYEELNMWCQLNEDPACALLLTYVRARELIAQKIRT
jgi:hypothetical protein